MLFMGSKKYPDEHHYESFISTHGGFCNAFTEGEHTVYQFDVDNEAFPEALDIFAHCFMSPLLSSSAMQREVLAVESEFVGARMSDGARLQQLLCHLSSCNDLMRKFSWGNARSLSAGGVDVHCLLSRLHLLNYAPLNMKLAVIASKSLFDIEAIVRGCFSSWMDASGPMCPLAKRQRMSNLDDLLPSMADSIARLRGVDIMSPLELRTVTRAAPIKSGHKLVMVWQLPSCHTVAGYRCKPHDFIGHLLGHEGAGSILSCLKRSNLATSVVAGVSDSNIGSNSMFSLFELGVELTQGGLCNWLLVVGVVHQYLHMLRDTITGSLAAGEECECRRVFEELQRMSELSYRHLDEEELADFVEGLSICMLPLMQIRRHDLLTASHLYWDWDPDLVSDLLHNHMTVRRAKMIVLSDAYHRPQPQQQQHEAKTEPPVVAVSSLLQCDDIEEDCNDGDNDDDDDDDDGDDGEDEDNSDEDDSDEDDGDESEKQDKRDSSILKAEEIRAQFVGLEEWLPIVLPPAEPDGSGPTCLECHLTIRDDDIVGGTIDPWWQQEPYFDTQFTQGEVPESLYHEWEGNRCNVGREGVGGISARLSMISARLSMPHANPYIPLDLSLLVSGSDDHPHHPQRVDVRPGVVLWHRPDTLFRTPKVALTCRLMSARDHDDLYSCMMLELLSIYLNDSLNEEMYMAALAGLHSSMQAKDGCIHMIISGFSEKALLLLRGCLSRCWLEVPDDDSASLLRSIEDLQRRYDNCDKQASRAADNQLLSTLKQCGRYPASCKRSALVELARRCCDPARLVAEVNSFRLCFFSQVHMEFSVFGNLTVDRCIQEIQGAADDGVAFLRCKGASPEDHVNSEYFFPFCESKAAIMQIPTKTIAVASCIPTSKLERNGCVEVYFQLGPWTVEDQTRVDLLEQLLEEPFFDELRTKQQRGYDVSCGAKLTEGTLGFVFKVVSSRFSVPENVDAIFAFVSTICSDVIVDSETTRHYSSCKVALEHRYLTPFTSHAEHADHDFFQIEHRTFAFDGPQRKADLLRSSSLFDIATFKQFAIHFFVTSPRVLIVQSTRDADLDSFTSTYHRAPWRRDRRICPVATLIPDGREERTR